MHHWSGRATSTISSRDSTPPSEHPAGVAEIRFHSRADTLARFGAQYAAA
jgi:hypothetical protein